MIRKINLFSLFGVAIILASCKVQQSTPSLPPAAQNIVTFDLVNTKNIDYGSLTKGYARGDEIFVVTVKNYNPLRYKIAATGTGTVSFMNSSSPVTNYVSLTTPVASANVTAGAPAGAGLLATDITRLQTIVTLLKNNADQLNKEMRLLTKFISGLVSYQNTIDNWKTLSLLDQTTIDARKVIAYNQLGDAINGYYTANNPFQPALGNSPNCHIEFNMVTDFPANVINDLNATMTTYKQNLADFAAFESAHAADMIALGTAAGINFPNFKKDVNDNSTTIQKFINDFAANQTPKLAGFAASITAVETIEYTTTVGPFALQGNDELTVKISKTDIAKNLDELASFPGITIKKHGGVKIDFSAGLFFSTLSDRGYTSTQSTHITQDSTVDNGSVVVKPNQTTFSKITRRGGINGSYGPMAFIHFHSMNTGLVNYGGVIGTGFMFKDNSKPVIAFGGNLMLVNYQRIILGFGAAMGSVTRLSSQYQENSSYRATITDVPTENHFDIKGMFSISWNLSK